ncbi:MAG: hypothetical protein ACK52S_09150 [Pirellula sp.]
MDAASFVDITRILGLSAAIVGGVFFGGSAEADESDRCPLKCKSPCESCQQEGNTPAELDANSVTTRKNAACESTANKCSTDDGCKNSCCEAQCPEIHESSARIVATSTRTNCTACDSKQSDAASDPLLVKKSSKNRKPQTLAVWVSDLLTNQPQIKAHLAVHGVVPDLELEPIVNCGHKICAGNKCYEVEDETVEGKACDQPVEESDSGNDEDPIIMVPAAPPVPTTYHFTATTSETWNESSPQLSAAVQSLGNSHVSVPASLLLSLMVERADATARLELTQALMEERESHAEQVRLLAERNLQLQNQISLMAARLEYSNTVAALEHQRGIATYHQVESAPEHQQAPSQTAPSQTAPSQTAPSQMALSRDASKLQSIQEDLTNIRRQIALLKWHQPVPFAPSYIGADTADNESYSWRQARISPYIHVFPHANAIQGSTECSSDKNSVGTEVK